jgi:hypothetical protein
MRRIYNLHPWDLDGYTESEIAFLIRDVKRLQEATTTTQRG